MANILITGGSGLVGSMLTNKLLKKGYQVSWLSRSKKQKRSDITVYEWDIAQNYIEKGALESADVLIHLAGAGVADERWTTERKRQIRDSRILSTKLLYDTLVQLKNYPSLSLPKIVIGASAIGIYGLNTGNKLLVEQSPSASDFLATVVKDWEKQLDKFADLQVRAVRIRVGVVLSDKGGALPKLMLPVKLCVGAALGNGSQYLSWIHIDDLCEIFIQAIENQSMQGVFNGVAPNPVTNREMTQKIAKVLHRPLFLPNIPEGILNLAMGEMVGIVTGGNRVSSEKIQQTGFQFRFNFLEEALKDLIK